VEALHGSLRPLWTLEPLDNYCGVKARVAVGPEDIFGRIVPASGARDKGRQYGQARSSLMDATPQKSFGSTGKPLSTPARK
jgi:hypothetical protein